MRQVLSRHGWIPQRSPCTCSCPSVIPRNLLFLPTSTCPQTRIRTSRLIQVLTGNMSRSSAATVAHHFSPQAHTAIKVLETPPAPLQGRAPAELFLPDGAFDRVRYGSAISNSVALGIYIYPVDAVRFRYEWFRYRCVLDTAQKNRESAFHQDIGEHFGGDVAA